MNNKSYTVTAESSNCVIKLNGDLAVKVWNYILEDVVKEKNSDDLNVAFKQQINSDMIVTEGYLGKI